MKRIAAIALVLLMVLTMAVTVSALPEKRIPITVYTNAPKLDGIVNEGEWDAENAIVMSADNCAPWQGEIDNAITFYYSWDDTGLYLAAKVIDDDVVQPESISEVYGKDAFQIALDPGGLIGAKGGGGGMFYSIGLMKDGKLGAVYHPYGGAAEEFKYTGAGRITDKGWEFEMQIPWTSIEILAKDGYEWKHKSGETINAIICMLDRDSGGAENNYWKTALAGFESSFKPADYALELKLSSEFAPSLIVTTAKAETAAKAAAKPAAAAQTYDPVAALAVCAAASCAAIFLVSRKKK
ncbi:MAG: hypothetical protein GX628_10875 [Clostridiales bacterium]|nr:hypothetical protein [Clostridiales bacterium]